MIDFELDIAAPAATVFHLFTDPDGLATWMVQAAAVDLRPDGRFRWFYANGDVVAGRFIAVDAPHRLTFRYGWERPLDHDVPPESTEVEVTLAEAGGRTHLRLVHTGLPSDQEPAHTHGWTAFLERLADEAADPRQLSNP